MTVEAVGGHRTGLRLSPGSGIWGAEDSDIPAMCGALLAELAPLDLPYIHLEATTDEDVLVELRKAWPGTLIVNPSSPMGPRQTDKAAADHWLGLGTDLISFGRAFIANPDLVGRLRRGCRSRLTTSPPGTRAATPTISPTPPAGTQPENNRDDPAKNAMPVALLSGCAGRPAPGRARRRRAGTPRGARRRPRPGTVPRRSPGPREAKADSGRTL
ncbi:hypothetical protein [Streptosporangium sp. NPDC002607]